MATGSLTFTRSDHGRVLAGVAAGFSRRHGIDPWVVRGALVVLSFAAGAGLVLYAFGAVLSSPAAAPEDGSPVRPIDTSRNMSVALVAVGLLLVVRSTGLWLGDAVMLPLAVVVAGAVLLGVVRSDGASSPSQLAGLLNGRHARARVTVGAVLVAAGLVAVGTGQRVSGTVRVGVFAAAISIVGVVLLVGPWIAGLAQAAAEERRERIRSEEREAMAAHLHDSVLQTLALIQRSADDPRRTASLARQQEHELREWLFGTSDGHGDTLGSAITAMAHEVERHYDVRVEVVLVGDVPFDDDVAALVAATREACVNAAKHSGERTVSLYIEVTPGAIESFVRDRGCGFDRGAMAEDRRGIRQSIEGRMERVGGSSAIDTSLGGGTEVRLGLIRRVPSPQEAIT